MAYELFQLLGTFSDAEMAEMLAHARGIARRHVSLAPALELLGAILEIEQAQEDKQEWHRPRMDERNGNRPDAG